MGEGTPLKERKSGDLQTTLNFAAIVKPLDECCVTSGQNLRRSVRKSPYKASCKYPSTTDAFGRFAVEQYQSFRDTVPSSVLKGMPSEATCCFENVENVQICPHFIAGFVWLFYIYMYAVAVLFGFEFKLL